MQTGFLHLHSMMSYIVVGLLALSFIASMVGFQKGVHKTFDHKLGLFTLIFAHLQLLVGFGMYFMSDKVAAGLTRFKFEHPAMMLIAIALITVAFSKTKRMDDAKQKQKTKAILYGIAFVLVISRIPWF